MMQVHPYDVMTSTNHCLKASKSIRMGNTSRVVADMLVRTTPPFCIKSVTYVRSSEFVTEPNLVLQLFVDILLKPGEVCDVSSILYFIYELSLIHIFPTS